MSYSTFLLPNLHIQRCNLVHNYLVSSCAPVFQVAMFCHGISSSLGGVCGGVALVVHGSFPHGEFLQGVGTQGAGNRAAPATFCVSQYKGAAPFGEFNGAKDAKHAPSGVSLQPSFTGDLNISVILRAKGKIGSAEIEKQFRHRRVAGGSIARHGRVINCSDLADAFSRIRTGYLLIDRSSLLSGGDVIDRCFDVLSEKLPDGRKRVPAGLGYSFLTPMKQVSGGRNGLPHVYAESVSGVVEYVPIRKTTDEERNRLWLMDYIDRDVFVVKQI